MLNKSLYLMLAVCAICLCITSAAMAQLLDRPESVVYDLIRNRHLVSNYGNGSIVIIDENGFQSVLTGAKNSSAGLHIVGNTVYVGCGSEGVAGYDLETGAEVMSVDIPGSLLLNDVTADTSGYLYVSDPYADKIFRIRLSDHSYSTLAENIIWPNGLLFDAANNRLLAATSTTQNIYAVDLSDGSLTLLVHVGLGHLDGLAEDNAGNIYISAQGPEAVYRYPPDLSGTPVMVSSGHVGPADIYFNKRQRLLCVPNIGGTTVDFVPIAVPQWTPVTSGDIVSDGGSTQGVSWTDYDGDGYQDLFMTNMFWPTGQNNWLYHNNHNATFTRVATGDIVQDGGTSSTSTWGDCDNDGNLDCLVANAGASYNFLYLGAGAGTFTRVTEGPIVSQAEPSTAAGWADYDSDGLLDLFVANAGPNALYHNDGASFTQVTAGTIATDDDSSQGVAWADYDNDHDLDLFVANANGANNALYRNDGAGVFTKITGQNVVTDGGASCGGSWGDYDNDGDLDLFVANMSTHPDSTDFLYRNNGDGTFVRVTGGALVNDPGRSSGSAWEDYDDDGDLDLVVVRTDGSGYGHVVLYQNQFGLFFIRIDDQELAADSGGLNGLAWGDYDRDGDVDLAVAGARSDNEDNLLFRNNGNGSNWISIRCIGTSSNRSAIGTRVRARASVDGVPVWQMREIAGQTGYGGQNSSDLHFGLGRAGDIDSLIVEWPGGLIETASAVPVNHHLVLIEGAIDPDGDGHIGNLDNCPALYNPGQEDTDGDGIGEACDDCPGDPLNDVDDDAICGLVDNCPYNYNPGQEDTDGDLIGNACDNCPNESNPDQVDLNFDGIGDACQTGVTPPGLWVTVDLTDSLSLLFTEVTEVGLTTVVISGEGPTPPADYLVVPAASPQYYAIQTDALYAGDIRVQFTYDPAALTGDAENLRIYHAIADKTGAVIWEDCTHSSDPGSNRITGRVTSLSHFILVEPGCACLCHGDPACDGLWDVLDVVMAVGVAFRGADPVAGPDCSYDQTDVSCDGYTDVIDVVKFVNVIFRGGDPADQFCNPCVPQGIVRSIR